MPEVSRFFGIAIRFYYNDHHPPHFHAIYGEHEALIEIETLAVLRGELPRRALRARSGMGCNTSPGTSGGLGDGTAGFHTFSNCAVRLKQEDRRMALIRIANAQPLEGFNVELTLSTGEVVRRDLQPFLNGPVFDLIRNDEYQFRQLRAEGGTVVWPNGADLCPDVVI